MSKKVVLATIAACLVLSALSQAAEKSYDRDQVKQFVLNTAVHFLNRDAETSLFALMQMRGGEEGAVLELFEYQLDIIVCETWDNLAGMEGWQRERALEVLAEIKAYRQIYPREPQVLLDGYDIGETFAPVQFSRIERAQKILDQL